MAIVSVKNTTFASRCSPVVLLVDTLTLTSDMCELDVCGQLPDFCCMCVLILFGDQV